MSESERDGKTHPVTEELVHAQTVRRKSDHLRIVSDMNVLHSGTTLLEDVTLVHQAIPGFDLGDIDMSTSFFGKKLAAPLMITSMTGGAEFSEEMNRGLALAAAREGVAFAVGSQRVMLRHPEVAGHFRVRKYIPDGVLLGNIGAVQLDEYPVDAVCELVDQIEADGICVHLNIAQELVQSEGQRKFSGILDGIARLVEKLPDSVLVKETGAGLSPEAAEKLNSIGVKYIDVSGSGGTSWTKVEMFRANPGLLKQIGETFSDWGVPTAVSVVAARRSFRNRGTIIASGGITNGLEIAKAMALGGDIGGIARPVLLSFLDGGTDGACGYLTRIKEELRIAMLLTGSANVAAMKSTRHICTGRLREWLLSLGWSEGNG
jgi:isopentenyl-diphosphate delta-isomerase